jgi:hypothetical protein
LLKTPALPKAPGKGRRKANLEEEALKVEYCITSDWLMQSHDTHTRCADLKAHPVILDWQQALSRKNYK